MAPEAWTVPPIWKGERCFIIAGGQSVPRLFFRDHPKLPGRILAIKDAVFFYPFADCMFYAGRRLHKERPELFAQYDGQLIVKRTVDDGVPERVKQVRRANAVNGISGLQTDPRYLGGWDSGGSAINLAYHFGVKQIVLIGFDLTGHHWNAAHPFPRARPQHHETHRISIDAMAQPLRRAGVEVFNTSPISTLKEYPFRDLDSLV